MSNEPSIPSFDEWFSEKHAGLTFEQIHMFEGAYIEDSMRQLTIELRAYTTDMARKFLSRPEVS